MAKFTPTKQTFNVTASLGGDTQISLSREWLPWDGEYPACPSAFAPLINGERTFAALAHAIMQAEKSIEIITWGFQASMYLLRDNSGSGKMLGELLEEAAGRGVQVKILVWFNQVKQSFSGSNLPGWGAFLPGKQRNEQTSLISKANAFKEDLRRVDHHHVPLIASGKKLDYQTDQQYEFDKRWHFRAENGLIPGLVMKVRDMDILDAGMVSARLKERVPAQYHLSGDVSCMQGLIQTSGATHHQKTVMVDYDDPARAVGFVMGHNMLSQYWDGDAHSCIKKTGNTGRDGPTAWQDISACIYGGALKGLNDNFARAWATSASDTSLLARDASPKERYRPEPAMLQSINQRLGLETGLLPVMGRVCRTQPQDNVYDILRAYMESVRKARQYIYIENQYFRFKDLVTQIHTARQALIKAGSERELYLFVVTNSTTDPDAGSGGVQTWKMLEALGRSDRMPVYTALQHNRDPANKDNQIEPNDIQPQQIPGLKSHICSLVSMDSVAGDRQRTYVHSKVMMVDDVFMILGSANINLRSMLFDSESAVAIQDTDRSNIIPAMRNKLWGLHTGDFEGGSGINFKAIFSMWRTLININSKIWADPKGGPLLAPLIHFLDTSPKLKDQD